MVRTQVLTTYEVFTRLWWDGQGCIMGCSGLNGGIASLIWWDVQAVNIGWPGLYGGDGQGSICIVQ